ncbi:MAG: beta strand repeat-containing protein [Janthinobacterium lividum]
MNAIYRLIWSKVANAWIAVAECSRTDSKGSRAGVASLSVALSITALSMTAAQAAPAGGVVVAGSAAIAVSDNVTTVNQTSRNVSLNWTGFNVGSSETVNFIQPSATALAINRITGGASQILGKVNANGQLYLINPSGILFGQSAQVNAGGLVASSLDLAGEGEGSSHIFSGPGRGSIINQGTLHAANGGYVGLLGNQVSNQGVIAAHMGTVALAGGSAITLSFSEGSLVKVQVDKSAFEALVENKGIVVADGGLVLLSAGARESLLDNLVNNSGVIEARGVENRNGKIVLSSAGAKGKTSVSGTLDVSSAAGAGGTIAVGGTAIELTGATLDASGSTGGGSITVGGGFQGLAVDGSTTSETVSADGGSVLRASAANSGDGGQVVVWSNRSTRFDGNIDGQALGSSGNGGSAEVSSAGVLDYRGLTRLLSNTGVTGSLLLDPYDLTISGAASSNVSGSSASGNSSILSSTTLESNLAGASVTVSTGSSGAQSGNITVADRVQWGANTTLTLSAAGAIAINAPVVNGGGGLTLNAGSGQTISASGNIYVGQFTLSQGNWIQNTAILPPFFAGSFTVGSNASFLRAIGGTGTLGTPWLLTDIYGVQGMGTSSAYLAGNYALAGNIDASSTSNWNGGSGFTSIGPLGTPFTGTLSGHNYGIVNLTINQPNTTTGIGLFATINNATISDLSLLNAGIVSGSNGTAILVGKASGTSTLSGITTTGTVAATDVVGVDNIGGVVGQLNDTASIINSSSAANVSGYHYNVGGLVGAADAVGTVVRNSSANGTVTGFQRIGGLVGHNQGSVSDAYATGAVTGQSGGYDVGGLVGLNNYNATVTRSYATGAVSGTNSVGSLVGGTFSTVSNSYWNTDTSGLSTGVGFNGGTVSNVTGVNSATLQTQGSLSYLDFTNTWYLTSGYNPTLRSGTTILGSSGGNLHVSTGANSATVINTTSLQNLLGVANVLIATPNGTLDVDNAVTWSSGKQFDLASSGKLEVNSGANLAGNGAGSGLQLFSFSNQVTTYIANLSVNNGQLGLFAPRATNLDGIQLTGSTLSVGSGTGSLIGGTDNYSAITFFGNNALTASAAGSFTLNGNATAHGRGILLLPGASLTTSGNVTLNGISGGFVGLALGCGYCGGPIGTLTNSAGHLTLNGTSYAAPDTGAGIDLYGETITNASTGNLTLNAFATFSTGVYASENALIMNNNAGGVLALNLTSVTGNGLSMTDGVAITSSGNASITARTTLASSVSTGWYDLGSHVVTNNSGNLTLTAGGATTAPNGFYSSGDLTLTNNGTGTLSLTGLSTLANGITVAGASTVTTSGAGVVNLTGAGGGSGQDISITASGAISLGTGTITGSNGKGISITSTGGNISLTNDTITTSNGALSITANNAGATTGVTLSGDTINVGTGTGVIAANTTSTVGVFFNITNSLSSNGTGSLSITGISNGNRGVFFNPGITLTTAGTTNITGNSTNYAGLSFCASICTTSVTNNSGNLTISGTTTNAAAGVATGVDLYGQTFINAGNGNFTVVGNSNYSDAVYVAGPTDLRNMGTGSFSISGFSGVAHGFILGSASTLVTLGNISLSGKSTSASSTSNSFFSSGSHTVTSNGGNLNLSGGDATTMGNGFNANGSLSLVNNGTGTININGSSAASNGINITGAAVVSTSGTGLANFSGAGAGSGSDIWIATSGAITLGGGTVTGSNGKGVVLTSSAGAISISNESITSNNGTLTITASNAGTDTGVKLVNDTLDAGSGGLLISGATSSASQFGINVAGNLLVKATGSGYTWLAGANSASTGIAVNVAAGQVMTTLGNTKLSDQLNSAGATAVNIAGTVIDSGGDLTITPWTANNLVVAAGGVLTSTGSGSLFITSKSTGQFSNAGTVSQGTGGSGSITISGVDGTQTNAGTISGGASAGAISLSTSGAGAIADAGGTINQAGSGAISLQATGSGTVSVDTINYSNAAASTLTVSGSGAVAISRTITSTGGALGVSISGGMVTLGPSISTSKGNISVSGPALLGTNATLAAGTGQIGFASTINGSSNLTATAATINLAQAVGATTALGAVSLTAANSMTLPSVSAASLLARSTSAAADITLGVGTVLSVSGSGNAATLSAGRNFINNSGAGAIVMTGGGRWLIYSTSPAADTFNNLDSANAAIWATSYSGTTPGFSQTGNRYVFAYQPTLTFSSSNLSKTYGSDATTAVASAYTVSGMQAGVSGAFLADTNATVYSGTPTAVSSGSAASASVAGGPYAINLSANNLTSLDNYALAFQSTGLLTVNPAALTVTAINDAKTYNGLAYSGGAGVSYSGFVNGQTASLVSGTPTYSGTAQNAVNAGSYTLIASGLSAPNYAISYVPGTLTIGQAALTARANNDAKTYNGLAYTGGAGVSYTGFVNGETSAVVSGTPTYTGSSQNAVNAGSYTINASGLSAGNYAISYVAGTLTVSQAALMATANNDAKTYNGLAYTGGAGVSYSGFVNGETSAVVNGTPTYSGSSQNAVNAGSYGISASGLSASNYAISYVPGTLTVSQAALTATANNDAKTYNGLAYTGGAGVSYAGFVNGETSSVVSGMPTYTGSSQNAVNAGNYTINASGLSAGNYAISYVPGTLTVSQAALTATANNVVKTYNGLAYTGGAGVSYTGFVNGETASVVGGTPTYTGSSQNAVNAGSYTINASGVSAGNYAISYVAGTLTVSQAALTATANNDAKTYNGLAYTGGAGVSYSGFVNGETSSVVSGTPTYTGSSQNAVNAGSYAINASGLSAGNYAISYIPGTLTIGKAALTATANNDAKTYNGLAYTGGAGVSYSGFVNGETSSVVSGAPIYTGSSQNAVNAGSYTISASGLSAGNYAISYVAGTLTVGKAALTATANKASKTYNGLTYTGGAGVSYSGFVNGETSSIVSGTPTYTGSSQNAVNAGSYTINASGLSAANYAISYVAGTLTVSQAALTATANNDAKTYNGLAYTGGAGVSYSGFVNGETSAIVSGTPTFTGSSQNAVNAGIYTINASGLSANNYAINYVPGTLTVSQAALTATANNDAKTYNGLAYTGGAGVSYSGFVNGETSAVVTGMPTYTGSSQNAVNAGSYVINASGLSSGNYAISYVPGTLTVGKAALTATANNDGKTYDGLAYTGGAGVSYSGLVNGETPSVISGTPTYSGSSQNAVNAGSYAINASGLSAGNYAISYVPGSLTVNPAALTATANNDVKTYDGLAYSGGAGVSYSGFVNGETSSVVSGAPTYGGSSQNAVNAGSYTINASGLSAGNYALSYVPGTLTVGKAALTATANNDAKTYNGLAYTGGAGLTYNGFVHGETSAVISGTPTYIGSSQNAVNAGNYTINASGLSGANYAISYVPGTLTVSQAALTATANNDTRTYNGLAYTGGAGVSYSGFVNGETASVVNGTPTYTGSSQNAVNVGSYTINASGLSAGNYAISYNPGALTIDRAALVVTPVHVSKTYDSVAYAGGNGVDYSGFVGSENQSVLGGTLVYGGTAQGAVNAGSYTLTASGLNSGNYTISYNPGTLTVGQAALAVAANSAGKTYDGTAYAGGNGVTYSGFVGSDNPSVLGGSVIYTGTSQGAANAGNYSIGAAGLSSSNYAINYLPGVLAIGKAALTVTANNANKIQDGLAYVGGNGVSYSGFVNAETASSLQGTLAFGGNAQGAITAGNYALTVDGLSANNYAISYVPGILSIGQAALAIATTDAITAQPALLAVSKTAVTPNAGNITDWNRQTLSTDPSLHLEASNVAINDKKAGSAKLFSICDWKDQASADHARIVQCGIAK